MNFCVPRSMLSLAGQRKEGEASHKSLLTLRKQEIGFYPLRAVCTIIVVTVLRGAEGRG